MERGQTNTSFLAYCVPQDSGADVQKKLEELSLGIGK